MGRIFQARPSRCTHTVPRWVSFPFHTTKCSNEYRGGIRGIVILEVLRQVELELGKRIPIQDFFDLIVGTRLVFSKLRVVGDIDLYNNSLATSLL